MDNRRYNIYFHTHTISGIIICLLLYVIFFAGSFSFFKDDLSAWQKNRSFIEHRGITAKDFNYVLDSLGKHHELKGRDFEFGMQHHGFGAYITMTASHDSTVKTKKNPAEAAARKGRRGRGGEDGLFLTYDFIDKKEADYKASYDMGEFLYRLHFLAQLNVIPIRLGTPFGYLLAGIVSFIFLFALITGLLLHWNKIRSNFFTFRPFSKWKTVFTDLHTTLGVIQFPFQFIFAVTGIVLIANAALMTPFAKALYKGDSEKLFGALEYADTTTFAYSYRPLKTSFDLNQLITDTEKKWEGGFISTISIRNYQDENMHVLLKSKPDADERFAGSGKLLYRVVDGMILQDISPVQHASYIDQVKALIYHLHFGDFGGRPLRVIYFVLGAMGCIVIISGILIWLVARDKTAVPKQKRVFNFWTANIFLGASMAMLPVTAVTMVALLFLKQPGQTEVYNWYFYSWLVLGLYFIMRRDIALTMRQTALFSVITCFAVPLLDGIVRGNWIWITYQRKALDILFIDLLFLSLSLLAALIYWKIKAHPTGGTGRVAPVG